MRPLAAGRDAVAYQVGAEEGNRLVWVNRSGTYDGPTVLDDYGLLYGPRLSPDGERISVSSYGGGRGSIWIVDPARNNEMRMTFEERDDQIALWSPDGRELIVVGHGGGSERPGAWMMDSDRPRSEHLLKTIGGLVSVDAWLPNGVVVLIARLDPDSHQDIWSLERKTDAEPKPVLATPSNEHSPDVSPDGEWLAYVSDVSGREEVYVRRMGGDEEVWKISTEGGIAPLWRRDGRELFFLDPANRLQAVATTLGSSFSAGAPEVLFVADLDEGGGRQYDASPDGQRFLLNRGAVPSTRPIVVVLGWAAEIGRSSPDEK
jgi:Tol biopolymer transport system component